VAISSGHWSGGTTISAATLSGGVQTAFGTATNTVAQSGAGSAGSSGGVAAGTMLSGGSLTIGSGGTASGTQASSGGRQSVLSDNASRLLIHHDCNAAYGVSGAPLLVRTRKGWLAAGINVACSRVHADSLAVTLNGAQALLKRCVGESQTE
jgi:autotransporter passenger strand-loop-strand repeat protein